MLCDGRVVCGCADPYGKRVLGDARDTSVGAIWTGETASTCAAISTPADPTFCGDCPLKLPLADDEPARVRPLDVGPGGVTPLPGRLYVETTAACNISCLDACCAPETGITKTRQAGMLDPALFERVLDELGPTLARLDFFNYGEAFLHKKAVEMCELVKARYPHIYLYTSTNGGAFTEDARPAAGAGRPRRDDVLARRRLAGRLRALPAARQLREVHGDDARRHRREAPPRARRAGHQLALHPVQLERQRPRDGAGPTPRRRVGRRSPVLGDHRSPRARLLAPVRARHRGPRRDPPRDLGRQQPRERDPRRDAAGADRGARQRRPTRRCTSRPARRSASPRASATCRSGPSPPPRPTAAATSASARSSRDADGTLDRSRLGARVPAARRSTAASGPTSPSTCRCRTEPGRYALRFDLVSEGIDWFETCGSEPTVRELVVGA